MIYTHISAGGAFFIKLFYHKFSAFKR